MGRPATSPAPTLAWRSRRFGVSFCAGSSTESAAERMGECLRIRCSRPHCSWCSAAPPARCPARHGPSTLAGGGTASWQRSRGMTGRNSPLPNLGRSLVRVRAASPEFAGRSRYRMGGPALNSSGRRLGRPACAFGPHAIVTWHVPILLLSKVSKMEQRRDSGDSRIGGSPPHHGICR